MCAGTVCSRIRADSFTAIKHDTLSLDASIKTYADAILQIKLISRYICHRSILLYLYVYELCTQLRLTTVFKE